MTPLIDRLQRRLKIMPNGCWEWQGFRLPQGYGRIGQTKPKRILYTHRVAWEAAFGPIPDGLYVLHSCDNPPCCNPAHLWLGTHVDNMADMVKKNRQRPCRGEKHGRAKLTQTKADAIKTDTRPQHVIAAAYGVNHATIRDVRCGRTWKETS